MATAWFVFLIFPLFQTLASTQLDAGVLEIANDHKVKVV